jgi:hypothetical protein
MAKHVALQRLGAGSLKPGEPGQKGFVVLSGSSDGPARPYPEAATDSVVVASLEATVEAALKWSVERVVELLADVAHPGLGRVTSVALKVIEVLGDAEALTSPGSPGDLRVPLLDVAGGIELDLNVHLRGGETADQAPPVCGFVAPGAGGLSGGWQLEIGRRPKADGKEPPRSGQDTWTVLAASIARSAAQQADRPRSHGPASPGELTFNLTASVPTDDPLLRAVTMREAASRLQNQLHARPEFSGKPVIVIYDRISGTGMWLVKPDPSNALALRRIEIRPSLGTGLTAVFLG